MRLRDRYKDRLNGNPVPIQIPIGAKMSLKGSFHRTLWFNGCTRHASVLAATPRPARQWGIHGSHPLDTKQLFPAPSAQRGHRLVAGLPRRTMHRTESFPHPHGVRPRSHRKNDLHGEQRPSRERAEGHQLHRKSTKHNGRREGSNPREYTKTTLGKSRTQRTGSRAPITTANTGEPAPEKHTSA